MTLRDGEPERPGKRLGFLSFAVGLGLLLGLRFDSVILGHDSFTLRDFSMFGYPLAAHLQASLFAGELPFWNPLNQAGLPFLAQWNTMTLYPPMWAAVMLPLSWSLSVFCIAHLFLGGLGMYRLAERFTRDPWAAAFAGFAFVGNGIVQNSLMWPNNIAALGWMPWVLLTAEAGCREPGRKLWIAVLVGTMQMLTGGPEVIVLTWMMATGMVAVQAWHHGCRGNALGLRCLSFLILVAAVAMLAGPQLFPFLDLLGESHRGAGFADGEWSASAMAWARFFTPLFHAIEAPGRIFYDGAQSWTHSFYAGLPVLALAVLAPFIRHDRRLWIASSAAIACLLLAMGAQGFIQPLLAQLPPFSLLRFPVKYLAPMAVLIPFLGAIGFSQIRNWDDSPESEHCQKRVSILLGLIGLGWLVAFFLGADPARMQKSDWVANSVTRLIALLIVAGCIWFLIRRQAVAIVSALVIAIAALDLAFHQPNLAPTIPAASYRTSTEQLEQLREELGVHGRATLTVNAGRNLNANSLPSLEATQLLRRTALFGNANLSEGISQVNGFYSLQLPRFLEVQGLLHAGEDALHEPVADFLGVSHVMYYSNMFHWTRRESVMPLVTGGQEPVKLTDDQVLDHLASKEFNPRERVLFPADSEAEGNKGTVEITQLETSAHNISFQARSSTNTFVVIAHTFHDHWHAQVNERDVPIHRANHAFQAVQIPAGTSEVRLVYRNPSFTMDCLLALGVLAACGIGLFRRQIV